MSSKNLLILLYLSVFLGPFGGNTVLALIPSLERFFNTDISFIAAAITLYMIPFAFFQLFSGAISDIYGRRHVIIFGLFTFSLASLFCAFSNKIGLFLGARALQGLGSAFISPIIMAIIGDIFPYEKRGRIMGGYDHPHLNLILRNAEEFIEGEKKRNLEKVIVRGDNIVYILP